jgi:hypothetical protein
MQTCPFCYSESDVRATVCPGCHAKKKIQYHFLMRLLLVFPATVFALFVVGKTAIELLTTPVASLPALHDPSGNLDVLVLGLSLAPIAVAIAPRVIIAVLLGWTKKPYWYEQSHTTYVYR